MCANDYVILPPHVQPLSVKLRDKETINSIRKLQYDASFFTLMSFPYNIHACFVTHYASC